MTKINVINADNKPYGQPYLFWFGTIGTYWVLVYESSLEDALEIAAEHLVEREYWGHITLHDDPDPVGDGTDPFECEDLTYTESGWLTSYEWGLIEPTKGQLLNLHFNNCVPQ